MGAVFYTAPGRSKLNGGGVEGTVVRQRHRLQGRHDRRQALGARARNALALLALLMWIAGGVAPAAFGDEAPPLQAVQDPGRVFAISVPATWQTKSSKGDPAVMATGPEVTDGPPDTFEVVVRDTVIGINDAQTCEEKVKWIMRVIMHKQFTTISEGPITIGRLPSYAQIYTWTSPNGAQRWSTQACVMRDGKVYVLTGTTALEAPATPARADLIMTILNSFRFTTKPTQ